MTLERIIHPRPRRAGNRREVPGISNVSQRSAADVIDRRLESARIRAGYRALGLRILAAALILYVVFTYGFLITQNHGQGMFPAMRDGDLCVVFRTQAQAAMGLSYAAGDVVAYRAEGKRHFGRVAAVAGDVIRMDTGGSFSVNGAGQRGDIFFPTTARGELAYPLTVPQGCLFVLGDRRTDTLDSRDFGPIPLSSVEGKVITILRRRGI